MTKIATLSYSWIHHFVRCISRIHHFTGCISWVHHLTRCIGTYAMYLDVEQTYFTTSQVKAAATLGEIHMSAFGRSGGIVICFPPTWRGKWWIVVTKWSLVDLKKLMKN
uniref:Putative ovule protein n=1 Tax=Solanum chacoense TaxID=4108 RepID=A0A0V0I5V7_SOLCH